MLARATNNWIKHIAYKYNNNNLHKQIEYNNNNEGQPKEIHTFILEFRRDCGGSREGIATTLTNWLLGWLSVGDDDGFVENC